MSATIRSALLLTLAVFSLTISSACGGGSSSSSGPTAPTPTPTPTGAAADVVITIVGMNGSQSFSPNPATVRAGQTVAWRNADSLPHTATADNRAFDTGTIAANATSAPIAMSSAGSFAYHCGIHPSMTGTLNVQ